MPPLRTRRLRVDEVAGPPALRARRRRVGKGLWANVRPTSAGMVEWMWVDAHAARCRNGTPDAEARRAPPSSTRKPDDCEPVSNEPTGLRAPSRVARRGLDTRCQPPPRSVSDRMTPGADSSVLHPPNLLVSAAVVAGAPLFSRATFPVRRAQRPASGAAAAAGFPGTPVWCSARGATSRAPVVRATCTHRSTVRADGLHHPRCPLSRATKVGPVNALPPPRRGGVRHHRRHRGSHPRPTMFPWWASAGQRSPVSNCSRIDNGLHALAPSPMPRLLVPARLRRRRPVAPASNGACDGGRCRIRAQSLPVGFGPRRRTSSTHSPSAAAPSP